MLKVLAKPKENFIYTVELPRLTAKLSTTFANLKDQPKKIDSLNTTLENILLGSLNRVAYDAYTKAAQQVECPLDAVIGLRLRREVKARAKQSAEWIANTTKEALDISAMSVTRALSSQRADDIAVNELSLQFFGGTRYGWGLDPTARKVWELSYLHDRDDMCDDNADEGPISINEAFQSGHFIPPAHIKCTCELGLVRIRRKR